MLERWRLILDSDRSAGFNMAVDSATFRLAAEGLVPPTLRFYGWGGPSVSLGRLQRDISGKLDVEYCRTTGIALVRRPTGGRAVLHGHDITFSISLPESLLPKGSTSVISSHRWLMRGIAAGLESLGAYAEIGPDAKRPTPASVSADCFAHVAECDIRVGRDKVVGAAQARSRGGLLEQGSIPWRQPLVDPTKVFPGTGFVPSVVFGELSREVIERTIAREFGRVLGVEFEVGEFTEEELGLARVLEGGLVVTAV